MGGDELLRSVARFQREMLRKREEQGVKLMAKEPKSPEEKGKCLHTHTHTCLWPHERKFQLGLHQSPDNLLFPSLRGTSHTLEEVR